MDGNSKEVENVDPDYESYNTALEQNEDGDKRENFNKLKQILEDVYDSEIKHREEFIEKVELQLCKARKLLHLLRYVIISSYYKGKELEYNGTDDESLDGALLLDKQSRIHPAVKKLLGKNIHNLDSINIKSKRKSHARINSNNAESITKVPEKKKIKLDVEASTSDTRSHQVESATVEEDVEVGRIRKRTKYRLVIGNISKFMPSSEEDILTHKWMLYVRGPKEKPDVSGIIDKVVFYLHPSYKPHDVVEVSASPYHLSRRGWGEFPVRVRIFFKIKLNKPIDIVHNIKLDKTFSGRQTLGNETLFDVFLYEARHQIPFQDDLVPPIKEQDIKIEDVEMDEDIQMTEDDFMEDLKKTEFEHDYCFDDLKPETVDVSSEQNFDHSYCLSPTSDSLPIVKEKIEQDESNSLIYGLDKSYLEPNSEHPNSTKTLINLENLNQLIKLNRKDIKFNNTKIIVFGKKINGVLTNFTKFMETPKISRTLPINNKSEQSSLRIQLAKGKFKNMGEALPFLFKKLPLYSDLANNTAYKRLYPFTASSLKEFLSWNIGKRRSSEWSRARTVGSILKQAQVHLSEQWNTKAILMYGRSHGYTPSTSYGLFERGSEEKQLLFTCYSTSDQSMEKFTIEKYGCSDEVIVNVSDVDSKTSPKKVNVVENISDPNLRPHCSYVKQTALNSGILLKTEEVEEGIVFNGAERMILEAVKCMADNLIRSANNHRICNGLNSVINKEDVEVALKGRPEFLNLLQFAKTRKERVYFS